MLSDIEIAQQAQPEKITEIAKKIGLSENDLELYGNYKAKITKPVSKENKAKLVLTTAINPTPAGEGKTTTTIGVADALNKLGKNTIVALREPSLGPVFGIKGGAAGGGYAQVIPMEDINLHFTGDIHALTAANNLLAAIIDNHIYQGNELGIDPKQVTWRRAVDMNDRQLRNIIDGLGRKVDGVSREDGFDITVASEVMAILCLAEDIQDLKDRLGKIIIGYTYDGKPVTAEDLNANGAMAVLLKDAIKPNLVQTLEANPAIIHGGPFANIAHGCNSIVATNLALDLADDFVITEAGFGADLGAEKFLDIKCRTTGLEPDAVILVATIRALKYNGGVDRSELEKENLDALEKGMPNLEKHIENLTQTYGLPVVVAINKFPSDTEAEMELIKKTGKKYNVPVVVSEVFEKGSEGGLDLAKKVIELTKEGKSDFNFAYELDQPIKDKITQLVKTVYGGGSVNFSKEASDSIAKLEELGYGNLPICIAKTQYSLSDDPTKLGRPEGFELNVKDVTVSAGAGFIVVLTGDIMKMPGLPKVPAANNITIDEEGKIVGLF